MAEEKKRVPTGVIVGLGAASAAAIGLGLWLLTRRPEEPEPPEPSLANLYGKVTDSQTGQSIADVIVDLNGLEAYTDAQGNYIFTNINPGSYTVTFGKEGYEPTSCDVNIAEGNNELNISLIPGGPEAELHGTITDSQTGDPIVNAVVGLTGPQDRQLFTNEYGDFSFWDLPVGTYHITITKAESETIVDTLVLPEGRTDKDYQMVFVPSMEGIEVRWLVLEPEIISAGDEILVRVQVLNISGVEGDFNIICHVNGATYIKSTHLTASGDGSWDVVHFEIVLDTPGTYTVSAGKESAQVLVKPVVIGDFCCPYCGPKVVCDEWGPPDWRGRRDCLRSHTEPFETLKELQDHVVGHIRRGTYSSGFQTGYFIDPICVPQYGLFKQQLAESRPVWKTEFPRCCKVLWHTGTSYVPSDWAAEKLIEYIVTKYGLEPLKCATFRNYGLPLDEIPWTKVPYEPRWWKKEYQPYYAC